MENTTPQVISMSVDPEDEDESYYRLRIGGTRLVKYLEIMPGTFDSDFRSFPVPSLPPLPRLATDWTIARLLRRSGELKALFSNDKFAGVENVWHENLVDVLDLERTEQLTGFAFEATLLDSRNSSSQKNTVIAKIARFEWEIPRIEQETRAYHILKERQASHIAPRFLGHVHENGRGMGFILEKVPDRPRYASIGDLKACEKILSEFHRLGLLHGDVNRYNFLIDDQKKTILLLDFEHTEEGPSKDT